MSRRSVQISPELVLRAYRAGLFPMAETRRGERLYWLDPELRGILPLDGFHLPHRLARTVFAARFTVTSDRSFPSVIASCARSRPGREDTWINAEIEELFNELARRGQAHSIESWRAGHLVGGLYGVALGAAFFGESMFSLEADSSKVALVHLIARLRIGGFRLLDTQFVTSHLAQFGAVEVPREQYHNLLLDAVEHPARWIATPEPARLSAEIKAIARGIAPSPA